MTRQAAEHAGGKWVARFGSALGDAGCLEVDLNYMAREPLFGVRPRPRGPSVAAVPVLDLHEVVGGKSVALVDRRAARDLLDARSILETADHNWGLVRNAFLAWGAATDGTFAGPA